MGLAFLACIPFLWARAALGGRPEQVSRQNKAWVWVLKGESHGHRRASQEGRASVQTEKQSFLQQTLRESWGAVGTNLGRRVWLKLRRTGKTTEPGTYEVSELPRLPWLGQKNVLQKDRVQELSRRNDGSPGMALDPALLALPVRLQGTKPRAH